MDLKQAYWDARRRRSAFEGARSKERVERLAELRAALDSELDAKYLESIKQARTAEAEAEEAWNQQKEEESKGRQYPYPLGTVLVEWALPPRLYRPSTPRDRKWTGRKGVLEVITADSEHPDNWISWKRADRGDVVIRILKKDGKPSRAYVKTTDRYERDHWCPEGTDLLQPELSWPEGGA